MGGCSIICVLIGSHTYRSKWVNFEIEEAIVNKMGLLGVYIHKLNDPRVATPSLPGQIAPPPNPMDRHMVVVKDLSQVLSGTSTRGRASDCFQTHVWYPSGSLASSTNNLGAWIEDAAQRAGR